MRILTVIGTLGAGGAERAMENTLPRLVDRGHHCDIAVMNGSYFDSDLFEKSGIGITDLRLRHRWDLPRAVSRLRAMSRCPGYDILHGHLFFGGLYVALAVRLGGESASVVTFHNLGYSSFPADTAWRKVRKQIDRAAMSRVDLRVAVSQAVGHHYAEHLRLGPMEVIPNGFDLEATRSVRPDRRRLRREIGVEPDGVLAVAVGRFVPEKSYVDLIEAFARVRECGHTAQLVIVGDGPGRSEVETLIRNRGLRGTCVLTGVVPHDRTLDIVASSDVFVSSSTHEGFPLAPGEAMALGVPVVATRVGGVPELVGEGEAGVLVEPREPALLAEAIIGILQDSDRARRTGNMGRRRIEENFDVAVIAKRWEAAYEAAFAHRGRK